jgi:Asp/Glu/hydantoin racemase
MRILIANPNVTQRMTDLMVAEARRHCRADTVITGVSAEFGVSYIANRSEMAIAGHALLDILARHHGDHDAVVIGAFCHSFVDAAKELVPKPVVGLAEAGMRAAQFFGKRISLISVGDRNRCANEEMVEDLNMTREVVSIRLLNLSGTDLANDQEKADDAVIATCRAAVEEDNADVVVLAGAAFAEMAGRIAGEVPVPVITPVPYAVAIAEQAVLTGWRVPTAGSYAQPGRKETKGLGEALSGYFR